MTIGGWLLCIFAATFFLAIGAFAALYFWDECENKTPFIIAIILSTVLVVAPFIVGFWYFGNTESGMRAMKDQESNFGNGINRIVMVYDVNGNVITTYEGRFDIETDKNSYILFDDEDGYRHVIYYTTGTITIDEIPD